MHCVSFAQRLDIISDMYALPSSMNFLLPWLPKFPWGVGGLVRHPGSGACYTVGCMYHDILSPRQWRIY